MRNFRAGHEQSPPKLSMRFGNGDRSSRANAPMRASAPFARANTSDFGLGSNFSSNSSPKDSPIPLCAALRGTNATGGQMPTPQDRYRRSSTSDGRLNNTSGSKATGASARAVVPSQKQLPTRGGFSRFPSNRGSGSQIRGGRRCGKPRMAARNEHSSPTLPIASHSSESALASQTKYSAADKFRYRRTSFGRGQLMETTNRNFQSAKNYSSTRVAAARNGVEQQLQRTDDDGRSWDGVSRSARSLLTSDRPSELRWSSGGESEDSSTECKVPLKAVAPLLHLHGNRARMAANGLRLAAAASSSSLAVSLPDCDQFPESLDDRRASLNNDSSFHSPLKLDDAASGGVLINNSGAQLNVWHPRSSALDYSGSLRSPLHTSSPFVSEKGQATVSPLTTSSRHHPPSKWCAREASLSGNIGSSSFSSSGDSGSSMLLSDCFNHLRLNNTTSGATQPFTFLEGFKSLVECSGHGAPKASGWNRPPMFSLDGPSIPLGISVGDWGYNSHPFTVHEEVALPFAGAGAKLTKPAASNQPEGDEQSATTTPKVIFLGDSLRHTSAVNDNDSNMLLDPFGDPVVLPSSSAGPLLDSSPTFLSGSALNILQPTPLPSCTVPSVNNAEHTHSGRSSDSTTQIAVLSSSTTDIAPNNDSTAFLGRTSDAGLHEDCEEEKETASADASAGTSVSNKKTICKFNCSNRNIADVSFIPCGHRVVCSQCVSLSIFNRCSVCYEPIRGAKNRKGEYVFINGSNVQMLSFEEAQKMLEKAIEEAKHEVENEDKEKIDALKVEVARLEGGRLCTLCTARRGSVLFQCGHTVCTSCNDVDKLKRCGACSQLIEQRIMLFS